MKRWMVISLLAASVALNAWFLWPRSPSPAGADVRAPEKRGPSLPSLEIDFEGTPLPDGKWKLDSNEVEAALRDAPIEWRDPPRDEPQPANIQWASEPAGGLRSINLPRTPRMRPDLHPLRQAEPPAHQLQRAINETTNKSLFR